MNKRKSHNNKFIAVSRRYMFPQELDKVLSIKFHAKVTKRNRDTNELESLKSCRVPLNGT